jgi:hypothetical protein
LIQQRREQVIVAPIHEHDVDRLVAERTGTHQSTEAATDDDNTRNRRHDADGSAGAG